MTTRKRRTLIALVITVILAAIGWHYYGRYQTLKARWGNMPAPAVDIVKVTTQPWYVQVPATGSVSAVEGTLLKAETAGRITHLYFQSGQAVKADAPLLDIDPGIVQGQLTAAQAQAKLTQGDYQRALALSKSGVLSKQDIATAFANAQADAAKVTSLQAQLTQNVIKAPFAGKLGLCLVNLGDYVTAGQALVNLQSTDLLRIDFTVPEQFANQVKVGDSLTFTTAGSKIFKAKVSAIDTALDPVTRTLAVRALINNPQHLLMPGNFVQINLAVGQAHHYLTIPQVALIYEADTNYVYKLVNKKVVKVPVTVLQQNTYQAAIEGKLKVGETIVSAGQQKVNDGDAVTLKVH